MRKALALLAGVVALSGCTPWIDIGTPVGPVGPEPQLCWPALDHTIACGARADYEYARDHGLIGELSHGGLEDQAQ